MDKELKYKLTLEDHFKKTMLGASKQVKTLDGQMSKLNKTMNLAKNLFVGTMVGGAIVGFANSIVDSLSNYEKFSASLRTLLYGDAAQAKALENQLIKLAATTPFSLVDVQEGSKQMLAYGFQAGKITKDLKMLGDIASGVGAPLTDIVYLYGTLRTQGRAYTRDIMQFTSRGIPIIGQLAKQFGVNESAIKDMVEQGKVGFPEVEKAFKAMTSAGGQFAGMMDNVSKTVGGKISNLGDAWEQLKVSIGKSQSGIISSTVSFLGSMTSALQKYFEDSNVMFNNFAENSARQFGFWAKALHETIGLLSGYNLGYSRIVKQEIFQRDTYKLTQPGNLQEAYRNKAELYRMSLQKDDEYKKGLIDRTTAERFQATFQGALKELSGNISLMKSGLMPAKDGAKKEDKKIGSATEWNIPRQNVYITVDKFGVIENMNVETMKDAAKEVKEDWSKELLEVLNDANLIARR